MQLRAGQPSGIEAAIHAMCESFRNYDTEALLLIDAFNILNRQVALRNVSPSLAATSINFY